MDEVKKVEKIAKKFEWRSIESKDPYMISFAKEVEEFTVRINVWFGRRGVTLGTYLKHPKQGRTQLFRRWCDDKTIEEVFNNPRVHTGKGYR